MRCRKYNVSGLSGGGGPASTSTPSRRTNSLLERAEIRVLTPSGRFLCNFEDQFLLNSRARRRNCRTEHPAEHQCRCMCSCGHQSR